MADDLTAALAEIRERYDLTVSYVSLRNPPPGLTANRSATSAADVPRLLAAVEAVLAQHQPDRVVLVGYLCTRHENHRFFSITSPEADDVVACKTCSATPYTSCAGCGTLVPLESCPVRRSISRALLGEETT